MPGQDDLHRSAGPADPAPRRRSRCTGPSRSSGPPKSSDPPNPDGGVVGRPGHGLDHGGRPPCSGDTRVRAVVPLAPPSPSPAPPRKSSQLLTQRPPPRTAIRSAGNPWTVKTSVTPILLRHFGARRIPQLNADPAASHVLLSPGCIARTSTFR